MFLLNSWRPPCTNVKSNDACAPSHGPQRRPRPAQASWSGRQLLVPWHAPRGPRSAGGMAAPESPALPAARFVMYQAFFSTGCLHFLTREMPTLLLPLICEEMGFLGGAAVVIAFLVILWRGIVIAFRAADPMGRYLATGITAMIVCQAMINLGVVLALLPTKGLPLPFISYGGTAVVTALAASGILLNISQQTE